MLQSHHYKSIQALETAKLEARKTGKKVEWQKELDDVEVEILVKNMEKAIAMAGLIDMGYFSDGFSANVTPTFSESELSEQESEDDYYDYMSYLDEDDDYENENEHTDDEQDQDNDQVQAQDQAQAQAQDQAQDQAQIQAQGQAQVQSQDQTGFEDEDEDWEL